MDDIKRLVNLLGGNTSFLPVVNRLDNQNLEARLFELVLHNNVEDDKTAMEQLYGGKKTAAGYRMLKSRFRKKLLNQVLAIDLSEHDLLPYKKIEAECNNLLLQAYKLVHFNEYDIAVKLLEQVKATAVDANITWVIVKAIEDQKKLSLLLNRKSDYYKQIQEMEKYSQILNMENEAGDYYATCKLELFGSTANKNLFLPKVPEILNKLYNFWIDTESSLIFNLFHKIKGFYYELIGDYTSIAEHVREAEELYAKGKIHPLWFDQPLNRYVYIYCLFRTKQFDKGILLAEDFLVSFNENSENWFAYIENYFLLAVHSKNLNLTADVLNRVYTNPFILLLQNDAKARWKLFRNFFVTLFPEFSIAPDRNISDLSFIMKDKLGFNFSLLILNFIKDLQKGNDESLEFHHERFRKYSDKHFKSAYNKREKIFTKLLMLLCNDPLNPKACVVKGKKLVEKLAETPPPGDAFAEVEIVPYEQLWDMCISILQDNLVHRKWQTKS